MTVRLPTTDGRAFTIRFLTKDKRPAQSGLPNEMLAGVMLLWFLLTAISVIFVAWDIRFTPESPVLKAGFVLLTCYTGPFGAFLYVLGCREPLPGLHEQYISVRWRQVLGSTMHCVAGDGVGILAGAVIGAWIHMPRPAELVLEYVRAFVIRTELFGDLIRITPHHPRRYFGRTRDDGDGGGRIQRESRHHSRHARLRAYLHRRGHRLLQRRGIQRHFRNPVLKPHHNSRVGNHVGIRVHNQPRRHQKGREQAQERWCS